MFLELVQASDIYQAQRTQKDASTSDFFFFFLCGSFLCTCLFISLQYMESLFWIKEVEDIDPEIQTTRKFLGHQQIEFQYRLGADNYVFWNSHN